MVAPDCDRPADADEAVFISALRQIARDGECWADRDADGDNCHCPVCTATWALDRAKAWRFEAACSERLTSGVNPREARIVAAWRQYMESDPDHRLAQVLKMGHGEVTRRDWYVATSVVQWLATNVGMSIIEAVGFKYVRFDEDRKLVEERMPPTLYKAGCSLCDAEEASGRAFCGTCGRAVKP